MESNELFLFFLWPLPLLLLSSGYFSLLDVDLDSGLKLLLLDDLVLRLLDDDLELLLIILSTSLLISEERILSLLLLDFELSLL